MLKRSMVIGLLGVAALAAACGGGSPAAPTTTTGAFLLTALSAQIADDASGSHTYTLTYAVHNGDSIDASITDIDTSLSSNGAAFANFTAHYSGTTVKAGQLTQNVFTVLSAAGSPRANSITVTIHYTEGSTSSQVSRTTPLS